jgi:hypothetical protein
MKDFRRRTPAPNLEQQRGLLIRRLVLIQTLGAPLFLGLALSAAAYFGDTVLIPVLADPQLAWTVMLVCGIGFAVEVALSFRTVRALGALKRQA